MKILFRKFLVGYFFLSLFAIVVETMLIISFADEMGVLRAEYKGVLQENRELKKKIALDTTNNNYSNKEYKYNDPVPNPTETYLTIPTYIAGNTEENLEPYPTEVSYIESGNKTIALYGTKNNIYFNEIELPQFFQEPLEGAYTPGIAVYPSCLPGAPRSYRNGYHQGTDYYSYDCGNACTYGTPVMAVANGVIVRIDHNYVEMDTASRNSMLDIMANIVADPTRDLDTDLEYQEYFDLLRGRQVIIDHGNGIYSDYCHLSDTNHDLNIGDNINPGEIIAYLGNSGTSKGAQDYDAGYVIGEEYIDNPSSNQTNMIGREWHLHLEYWYCPNGIDSTIAKTNYLEWQSVKKLYGY